jgi:hypothetical protein
MTERLKMSAFHLVVRDKKMLELSEALGAQRYFSGEYLLPFQTTPIFPFRDKPR